MSKKQNLYQKAKNSPKSISFSEIQKLAQFAGFIFDRQKGSHKQYKRKDNPSLLITFQPRKGDKKMAMPYQVREILSHIDQYSLLASEGDNE
jgi:predicted RNA binding protein YcfA (HicA-like mRNA interferase family)